ncbi:hypothetical protein GCM10017600_62230 [Streptosporangium carneum]|uniref:Uncharacterized protein n=1 Tax=Streptosporangium carneum TaxID=47481 RepID=A0A9W6I713_9ACTN|nr:hypothetical protein GCM10017600_62230 [Streptosporangium carneum]
MVALTGVVTAGAARGALGEADASPAPLAGRVSPAGHRLVGTPLRGYGGPLTPTTPY